MKTKFNKKASITEDETVKWILRIAAFVIILLLIGSIAYQVIISERTCHDSIVLRSAVNYGFASTSRIVPLKCQTEKICLTSNGENCNIYGKPTKENYILKRNINSDPEKAKQQILNEIAESMVNCHSILGEGKLLFMPREYFNIGNKNYCLVCSRIVLQDDLKQHITNISYAELYRHLATKKTSEGKTYLDYLYPGWTNWRYSEALFRQLQSSEDSDPILKAMKFSDWSIDLSNPRGYVIVAQISTKSYGLQFAKTAGAAVLGTGALISGVGAPLGAALIGGAAAGGITYYYTMPNETYAYAAPTVYPADPVLLQNLNCDSFETAP